MLMQGKKRRFFYDQRKYEQGHMWFFGAKASKGVQFLALYVYDGHGNNAMLFNILFEVKHH